MFASLFDWISELPISIVGGMLLAGALLAGFIGHAVRLRTTAGLPSEGQEGYIVSGVLGLLALMLAFTLAMAVDRFETRRQLVLEEANAIGTTYLRSQLLGEPHRTRLSKLLVEYTENRIALATAPRAELLATSNQLLTDLWAATAAAFDSISN